MNQRLDREIEHTEQKQKMERYEDRIEKAKSTTTQLVEIDQKQEG